MREFVREPKLRDRRRGVATVNAQWGNLQAILAGDFLLARASEIAASLSTEVAGLLANTIGRLCHGDIGQLRTTYDPDRTTEQYLTSIQGKTASLFSTSARIGGLDLPPGVSVSASIYGAHHRADLWPEPERFRPERFLGTRPAPNTFFPFGGGVRRCLGEVRRVAATKENLMPVLLEAAEARCTVGEIMAALADVFGRYDGAAKW